MGTIYVIENTVNGKKYVGQSVEWKHRKYCHFNDLRKNKHKNKHLQAAWNKHGESAFIFTILVDDLPEKYLDDMERGFIFTFKTMNKNHGYNKESGGNLNKKRSPEAIEKNRQRKLKWYEEGNPHPMKGKKKSPEEKERDRQAQLKLYKEGYVSPHKGKKKTLESIEKRRTTFRKRKDNPSILHRNCKALIDSEGVIWPSIKSFCTVYSFSRSTIRKCLKSGKPYRGIYIKYYEEHIKEEAKVG